MIQYGQFTSLLLSGDDPKYSYVVPEVTGILICVACALALGLLISLFYMFRNNSNKGFAVTLVLLPAVVTAVVTVVNGNWGAGIAIGGAFGLVRFRSAQGTARDIATIFMAMAAGLVCGAGYVLMAFIVLGILLVIGFILLVSGFGSRSCKRRELRITVPESLDYTDAFEDIFKTYTREHELEKVKTTNMGSLYKLYYNITLADPSKEKEMIDAIRVRNGNLEIVCGVADNSKAEL